MQRSATEPLEIGLNLFMTREPAFERFTRAMAELGELHSVAGTQLLRLEYRAPAEPIGKIRVHFLTPTEIKGADRPDFGTLMARIRDRISALRALYGAGPLEIDFKELGDRAGRVRLIRHDLKHWQSTRLSKNTGQRHALGGFTGIAEYAGDDLAAFIPYMEIARWTGVGRQTVWGKGEVAYEILAREEPEAGKIHARKI